MFDFAIFRLMEVRKSGTVLSMKPIKQRMDEWREAHGYSVVEAANALGVSITSYMRYFPSTEDGAVRPRIDTAKRIAERSKVVTWQELVDRPAQTREKSKRADVAAA